MTKEQFIESKIADVEQNIRSREDSAKCFRSGTNAEWKIVSDMHPSTRGKPMSKRDRMDTAEIQERILRKLTVERDMFRAVLEALKNQRSL